MSTATLDQDVATYKSDVVTQDSTLTFNDYMLLKPIFVEGYLKKIPNVHERQRLISLESKGYVIEDNGEFHITQSGVDEFIKIYIRQAVVGTLTEIEQIDFFEVNYSKRLDDGKLDDPLFNCSNEGTINFIKMLVQEKHLSVSSQSCEYDYAILDFIDEGTGESYLLFPGDVVVNTADGYTVHNFRTE